MELQDEASETLQEKPHELDKVLVEARGATSTQASCCIEPRDVDTAVAAG